MAKQSFKDSIYQQIANSQVQQVIKDQRDQDYKLAQDLIAQYQPTNDDMALAQNLIAQYQQPAPQLASQPEQAVPQPQIPVLKKQTGPTKEEKLKAFSENYARQQQEESALQSARSTAEKETKREAAAKAGLNWINGKDFQKTAKQGKALQLKEQEEAKRKEANKVLENQLTGKPVLTDEQEELERQILNADRYVEDDPNKQPWNKRLLSKDQKNAVVQNTTPETVDRWLSPETKLTEREKGEAKAYASAELQKFNYGPNKQPLLNTPEERQHYADMVNLINKTNTVANFAEGVIKTPYNLADMVNDGARALGDQLGRVGAAVTDKFGVTEGATQRHNEEAQAANDFFNQNEKNMRQSIANAQTQNPLAFASGQFTGQMGMYMLTNPVFDGIAEGAGISSTLGKFFVNQGAQNAQDLVLDTAPLVRDLMQDGTMSDADKREVFNNVLLNALGNAAFGTAQELPTIMSKIDEGRAIRQAERQAFTDNIVEGRRNLDDIIANEAERADAISRGYDYDYKGVPTQYSDDFVEPERLVHSLTEQPVSPEYADAVRKLESGQAITSEEYNKIPEVIEAKKKVAAAGEETYLDNSPERLKKREKWLNDLYNNSGSAVNTVVDGKQKTVYNGVVRRDKRADIILGLPSSGKSSAVVDPISFKYKSRLIDSDEAKKLIDEFDNGWGAGRVHEESSDLADKLLAKAILDGENIVIPKVGGNYKSIDKIINTLKKEGYSVNLHFNDLDPNKAAGRNMRRFATDGRFLDLDATSFKYGNKPSDVFERLVKEGKADGYTRVSNDVRKGQSPVQVKGTEDISFDWRNNRQGGSQYSEQLGEISGGRAPETSSTGEPDTALINGGNDYGTDNATIQSGAGRNINGAEPSNLQGSGGVDEGTGKVGRGNNRVPGQSTVNEVTPELRQRMDSAKIRNVGLKPSTDVNKFSAALDEARKYENNTHGVFVSPKSPEEIQGIIDNGGKALLSDDGTSGVIITADGDIEGVFYNKGLAKKLGLPTKGAFDDLMLTAIANGGKKLDCYGDGLAHMYARMGLEPVVASKYIPGKEWSAEMDAWKASEAARKGINVDDINTDVYVFKLRDGWTVDDVMDAMQTGSLKKYADNLDLSLDAVNKDVPKSVFEVPEDDVYMSTLNYRDTLMKQPETGASFDGAKEANKVMAEDIGISKESGSDVITSEPLKERGTSRHIRNDGTPMKMEDVADEVVADFEDNPDMYRVLKNADTKAKAEKIYAESDNPEVEFRDMLRRHDPAALPLGQQLAKDYSAAGNHAAASQIYREMGEQLTKAGQFSQAAVINMMKNDPLTALNYAERQIDNLNQQGLKRFGKKWKDFSLTDAEKELFNNIKPGDEDAIRAAYDTIGERLGKEYPTSFMDKLLEARKIAMLFNVRTNVRNVLANVPTLGMRWMSDRVDAVGQNIAHLINPDIKVTQSLTGSGVQGRKLAKQVFESDKVQALVKGTAGKYEIPELKNSLVQNKQMYKGTPVSKWIDKVTNGGIQKANEKLFGKKGVQSGLETIRNATYKMLDLGDSPFVKENFVERLGSYIKAQGIKNIDDIPEEAIQTAWEEAIKATYKDNSWAVQMLKGVKGGLEKIPGVGRAVSQAAIPFLQAPGNIAARMVDYSPVKASKGIGEIIAGAGKNDVEQVTKGIADAAKGLTGSGLILLGMGLHKAGVITGAYSDDKDQKAYEKQNGFREYALHLGDKYFTYDWAQPFAEPLIVGTLLSEAITKSDEYNSDLLNYLGVDSPVANKALGVAEEGIKASVNSWFGASPLQGLQELMSGGYSGDDIAGNIKKVAMEDFAGAFVPSSVNAVAKSVDNTTRNTYDPSSSTATFVNQQKAKIPVLSETLPAKYDTWGNEMKNADNKAMAAASKFLIPGDYSYNKGDKIDQEIMRLYEGTNNAAVFPQVAPTIVGDKKLNNKEVSTFQKDMGQRSRALAEDLINNKAYDKLEDTEKAEVLDSLYKVSKAITERDKFGKEPSNTYKKLVEIYDKAGKGRKGQKALVEEVLTKNTLNKYDVTDSESARQILEDHGEKWLKRYGDAKDRLNGSSSSEKIEGVINAMPSLSKKDKAEMYSYLKPSASPGSNPYGYVPGITYDPKEDKTYQKAKAIIPGMSPENYYETYDKIDANSNSSISQDELYQYFESNSDLQDAYIKQLWEAYGGYTNKDGKKKQLIKNSDGSYTSSY